MPKAKKLPSGSWRCQVLINGKRRSFTVDDPSPAGRKKCEQIAAQAAVEGRQSTKTVKQEIDAYIESKKKSLSVSTLAAYKSMAENSYKLIGHVNAASLTDAAVQAWIDALVDKHSPKTVKNAYGLLSASCGHSFRVKLPQAKPTEYYTPTDKDIKTLLASVKGSDLERAVLLAAFGTLREGEVCALTVNDFTKNTVTVSKSMAWNGSGYVIKSPKTVESNRTITLPPKIIKRITKGKTDRIVDYTPKNLSQTFARKLKEIGLPPFRFHDLRAYSASVRHALGVPDAYILADGGWKTDSVMKRVYRRAMDDKRQEFSNISGKHFSKLV